ncbi:glutathione S-transferase family protein [Ruegeria lacuscaerulensis]|uniref:glutathione S-transferase family protein n=1 Tax=Ruegeria lacuscaerulensis TaxID=55218 RepID=UPI00147F7FD1|nr:glutathione S-transferase N-terminal domain-containing protein [Ruegeria lacuscaerulensis]
MIDFYYSPTPNGWKVAIMLGETGLEHRTVPMDLRAGDQFTPAFRAISPNAKMPAIVDHDAPDGPQTVFESGAILLYLAERTGQFGPQTPAERIAFNEWLFWQAANQGPMGGQLSHFVNYSPEDQPYAHKRYKGEFERALAVMETWLQGREYMLDRYSIVDMMCFPWAFIAKPLGVSLDGFPNVAAWRQRIKARPAVIDAINLHKDAQFSGKATAQQHATLFNQSAAHLMTEPTKPT